MKAFILYVYTTLERGVEICICSVFFVFIACTVDNSCTAILQLLCSLVYELTCILMSHGLAYFSPRIHLMP